MSLFTYRQKDKSNEFEGWYTRLIDPVANLNIAIIFGVTTNEINPHAFIQIANHNKDKNLYRAFDIELFHFNEQLDTVTIGTNELSTKHLLLDIGSYKCNLSFEALALNKKSAMGVFSKLPLECFQEVIFTTGKALGIFEDDHLKTSINADTYMEKTYGHKFPSKWLWLQSQHGKANHSDITLALGKVPIKGKEINGFFCLLNTPEASYKFATYNMSKIIYESYKDDITITMVKPFYKLIIKTKMADTIKLLGPANNGKMIRDVFESLNSEAEVILYHRKEKIFETTFENVGLENTMD